MLNLIYTYKIIPTKKQIEQIEHNLNVCKVVWNNALYQRKLWSNSRKCEINQCSLHSEYIVKPFEYPNYHKQSKELGQQKKINSFLKNGNAQAIAKTLGKLDRAFQDMRKKSLGYPRYKKAMKSFVLIPAKDNAKLESNAVVGVPLLKTLRIRKPRDIPEGFVIKQIQIVKKASGYYVNLTIQSDIDVNQPTPHGYLVGDVAAAQVVRNRGLENCAVGAPALTSSCPVTASIGDT